MATLVNSGTLKEKTAKGLFWGGLSSSFQQVLGAIFGLVTARILNAEDYGLIGMLAIFSGIVNILQEGGFTAALVNRKDLRYDDYNSVFWFTTVCGIVFYVILFLLSPLIASFYRRPELLLLSRLLFLSFVFSGVGVALNAYLHKNFMVKERAKSDMIAITISGIVGILLAVKGFAATGLAIQSVVYCLIGSATRFYYSPWKPAFHFQMKPLREMFGFSSKLIATNFIFQVNHNMLSVTMGKFYSVDQLGFYTQGQKWMWTANQTITGMIGAVAQPVLVEVDKRIESQRNVFRKMIRFGAFISFPMMAGLAIIAKEFIWILLGEKWMPSVPYLQILCVWGCFSYLWILYIYALMSNGKSGRYLLGTILTGIIQLFVVWLVYPWGTYWMTIGFVAVSCLSLFYWHIAANQSLSLSIRQVWKDIFPYLTITAISILVAWLGAKLTSNHYISIFVKVLLFSGTYLLIAKKLDSTILNEVIIFFRKRGEIS